MKIKKIVIIGMGLIGGSISKAVIKNGLASEVVGVCRRRSSLLRAIKEKSLTKGYVHDHKKAIAGAEIVIIATPVHTIKTVLDNLAGVLDDPRVIVTDVGSTKKEIVKHADRYRKRFTFIGGHPLAGSEKMGVEYSRPDLFNDSICILTPDKHIKASLRDKLAGLWRGVGAKVIFMTPAKHDEYLAFSSHLPHVVAYALAGSADAELPREMFATGFKDTTRIASSEPVLWSDIFLSNRGNILKAVKKFKQVLLGIESDMKAKKTNRLVKKLEYCKGVRDGIV